MIKQNLPIFYYDASCSFCTKTKDLVSKLDSKQLNFVPLSNNVISSFQKTLILNTKIANNVMYYVNKHNKLFYGSDAFFAYLRDKNGAFQSVGLIGYNRFVKWLAKQIYTCIALNRFKLSFFIR